MSIRGALEVALDAMTPPLATAWRNVPFSPPQLPTPYQRADLLLADIDRVLAALKTRAFPEPAFDLTDTGLHAR